MRRHLRSLGLVALVEAGLLGLILLFPGAGHSPLLYTQLPALMIVGRLDPTVGTCITCSPVLWIVGALGEILLLFALISVAPTIARRTSSRIERY